MFVCLELDLRKIMSLTGESSAAAEKESNNPESVDQSAVNLRILQRLEFR